MIWYIFFFFMFWHILLLDPDIGNLTLGKMWYLGGKYDPFWSQKRFTLFVLLLKQNWFTSCHCSNVYFITSDVLPHLLLGFISQCLLTCLCESLFTEDRQVRYRSYEISVKVQICKSWSQSERKENKRRKNWVQTLTTRGFLIFYGLDQKCSFVVHVRNIEGLSWVKILLIIIIIKYVWESLLLCRHFTYYFLLQAKHIWMERPYKFRY